LTADSKQDKLHISTENNGVKMKVGDLVKHHQYGLGIIVDQYCFDSFNKGETTAKVHFALGHFIEHFWLFELEAA
jgi:hypothetical protein